LAYITIAIDENASFQGYNTSMYCTGTQYTEWVYVLGEADSMAVTMALRHVHSNLASFQRQRSNRRTIWRNGRL